MTPDTELKIQHTNLVRQEDDGKGLKTMDFKQKVNLFASWGMNRRTSSIFILVIYFSILNFGCDNAISREAKILAPVILKDQGWGFVDQSGKMVIRPQYEGAMRFSQGLAAVRVNMKWGFVNVNGKMIISPIYDDVMDGFSEDMAAVKIEGDWIYIDTTGNKIINHSFWYAKSFSEGLASVSVFRDTTIADGYIDKDGKFAIEPKFDDTRSFKNGLAVASILKGGIYYYGLINKNGDWVVSPNYSYLRNDGSLILFTYNTILSSILDLRPNGPYGFMDKHGTVVIEPRFESMSTFSEGLKTVKINSKWGYIDESGKEIIKTKFDMCRDFSQGLAAAKINDKWGFIDKSGQWVIKAMFDGVSGGFSNPNAK